MASLYLIRHPHTIQDPAIPPSRWQLSDVGYAQVEMLVALPFWDNVTAVYTSPQPKTTVVGDAIQAAHGLPYTIEADLDEAQRDRWLSAKDFQVAQQAFFAQPDAPPVDGWEPASAAQSRFSAAMDGLVRQHPNSETLVVVAHGTVLALYTAALRGATPTYDGWHQIGFAAIMVVDRETLQPLTPFLSPPYDERLRQP